MSRAHLQAQMTKEHMSKVKEILLRQRSESKDSFGPERSFNENYIKPINEVSHKLPIRAVNSISHIKNSS